MGDEERAQKQAFLMAEIIEKQYNPDDFMAYCEQLKGSDIDNWTMPELTKCVEDFQRLQNPPPVEPPAAKPSPVEEKKHEEVVKETPKLDKFVIQCRKFDEGLLSQNSPITFEISEAVLVKGGFFSSDYHVFPIKTLPLTWEVSRRFGDFIWLWETLVTMLPGNFIPPIPTRKSRQGTLESQLKKKRKIIMKFTSRVSRNSLLLNNEVIEKFFSIKDPKEFEDYKKRAKKNFKKPEQVEHCYTLDGNAQCDISFAGQLPEKLLDYAATCESIEKKLKRHATSVMNDIMLVKSEFLALSDLIKQLADIQENLPNREKLRAVYQSLSDCVRDIAIQEDHRVSQFEEYFNMYFKYSYLEKEFMREMLKERENAQSEYLSAEAKKKNVERARNMFGYLNHRTLDEIQKAVAESSVIKSKHFLELAEHEVRSTTELHALWTKFRENLEPKGSN